jgi:RNA polymerase sigma factor (sigma-70 family)
MAVSFSFVNTVINVERLKGVNRMYNRKRKRGSGNDWIEGSEFDQMITPFYSGLKRYCQFLSGNKWDGEDLAQEAVLKANQSYLPSEITSALLKKIAYHHWIDTLRKREHQTVPLIDQIVIHKNQSNQDSQMDTVKHLLNHLTPKQAIIFMLKEGFSYQSKEIAHLLGTTDMAVKSSLHRAKNRLSKEETLQTVDFFWDENEKALLFELMYQSLQTDDPQVLIDRVKELASLLHVSTFSKSKHSRSSLNFYSLAA